MRKRGGRDIWEDIELMEFLQRCLVSQGLMGTHGIVDVLPTLKSGVVILDRLRNIIALVILPAMRSLCPFDFPVQFGTVRREYEKPDAALFALFFEFTGELTSAVDLNRLDLEGTFFFQCVEKLCRQ